MNRHSFDRHRREIHHAAQDRPHAIPEHHAVGRDREEPASIPDHHVAQLQLAEAVAAPRADARAARELVGEERLHELEHAPLHPSLILRAARRTRRKREEERERHERPRSRRSARAPHQNGSPIIRWYATRRPGSGFSRPSGSKGESRFRRTPTSKRTTPTGVW